MVIHPVGSLRLALCKYGSTVGRRELGDCDKVYIVVKGLRLSNQRMQVSRRDGQVKSDKVELAVFLIKEDARVWDNQVVYVNNRW